MVNVKEIGTPTVDSMVVAPRVRFYIGSGEGQGRLTDEMELTDEVIKAYGSGFKGGIREAVIGARHLRRVLGKVIFNGSIIEVQNDAIGNVGNVYFGQPLTAWEAMRTAKSEDKHGRKEWECMVERADAGHDCFIRTENGLYMPVFDGVTVLPSITDLTPKYHLTSADVIEIRYVERADAVDSYYDRIHVYEMSAIELDPMLGDDELITRAQELTYGHAIGFRRFNMVEGKVLVDGEDEVIHSGRLNVVTTFFGEKLTKYQAWKDAERGCEPESIRSQIEAAPNKLYVRTKHGNLVALNDGDEVVPITFE